MEGLSVPEQVEYIFEKYPHMKKKDERKILSGWFLIALLLLVGVLGKFTQTILCIYIILHV